MSFNNLEGVIPTTLSNCSRLLTLVLTSNHIVHSLPSELGSLSSLQNHLIAKNNFSGKFPTSLGNLTSLRQLSIAYNNIEGEVPHTIDRLNHMKYLQLSVNNLSGVFPSAIYNMSSLEFLSIGSNHFSGNLRTDFGNMFTKLVELYLGDNSFSGHVSNTLSNITSLEVLEISINLFIGSIPISFGTLHKIRMLRLNHNSFGNNLVGDLDFLSALVNCTQLQVLDVGYNKLGGDLPILVSNLSHLLTGMYFGGNSISGVIPHDIGNLKSMQSLGLENNFLKGVVPTSIGKLSELRDLLLNSNRMSGEIPSSLGNISQLETIILFNNSFEGSIPRSLGNCTKLLYLKLGSNRLSGIIPEEIMQLESLVELYMSRNFLTGPFPRDIGKLKLLVVLSAINNRFHGSIPENLGSCLSLQEIYLGGNEFNGAIPDIRNLKGLKYLDLSNNSLSGNIPEYLANVYELQYLDLSNNNFEGMVPKKGIFQSSKKFSISGNQKLCGGIAELKLRQCPGNIILRARHSSDKKKILIGVVSFLLSLLALSLLYMLMKRKKKDSASNDNTLWLNTTFHERISYEELRTATSDFSSSNLIGSGNFSSVFKGLLGPDSKAVAVKVLNLQKHGAAKSFIAECEALKRIRHRNLVKLVTVCSSTDFKGNEFKALVYELVPNGNLDMWLHPEEVEDSGDHLRPLLLLEKLNIAIDVASVLDYIHTKCHESLAHCDLKPRNILLDNDLTAHVSDFGLARILDQESFINQLSSTGVRGTIGYAAPEYGLGGKPSREGDLYSFGVLVLEMFSGKRPTDQIFVEGLILRSYTESRLSENVLDITDISIIQSEVRNKNITIAECLKMVFNVGLRCSEESPTNRMTMTEASAELVSIKKRFFQTKRRAL